MLSVKQFLTGSFVGLGFGFALNRGMMDDPDVIQKQFSFDAFLMLRMFLTASVVSTGVVFGLHLLGIRSRQSIPLSNLNQLQQNLLGGALLGSGMALAGSCPGTVWAQMGSQFNMNTLSTVVGGIAGGGLFALGIDRGSKWLPMDCHKASAAAITHSKVSYFVTAAYIVAMLGVIAVVESYFPWRQQVESFVEYADDSTPIGDEKKHLVSWDPIIAGAMIGLLQIPTYTLLGSGLGSSTAWMYLASKVLPTGSKFLQSYAGNTLGMTQGIQAVFMMIGSFLSMQMLPEGIERKSLKYREETPEILLRNFVGGVCLILGARIAGGCTSGHGLTGIANLNIKSFATVAAMFAAGGTVSLIFPPYTSGSSIGPDQ